MEILFFRLEFSHSLGRELTLVATIPVYNTAAAVGLRTLPVAEEDPEGDYIIAYRLAE